MFSWFYFLSTIHSAISDLWCLTGQGFLWEHRYIFLDYRQIYQGDGDEQLFHIEAYRIKENWTVNTVHLKKKWLFSFEKHIFNGYPSQSDLYDTLGLEVKWRKPVKALNLLSIFLSNEFPWWSHHSLEPCITILSK